MSAAAESIQMQEPPLLELEDLGSVCRITLNNPKQYNPLSRAMLNAIQTTLDDLTTDESTNVVILAARGNAFCAGHDLKEIRAAENNTVVRELFEQCNHMMLSMTRLPQPIIASVQGIATAAGCQLVANCDLAVASTTARFAVSGVNLGLFCSTPSVALSRNLGRKNAMEMLLTGDFIEAEEAQAKGLVNRIASPENLHAETEKLAFKIAEKPREVLSLGKQLFYEQIENRLDNAYAIASDRMACNVTMDAAAEGIDAFIEKRAPVWK